MKAMPENEFPTQIRQLIRKVLDRTHSSVIRWQAGSAPTEFLTALNSGAISLRSRDGDGDHPFEFSILNPEGVKVETWRTDSSLAESADDFNLQRVMTSEAADLAALYVAARRSAIGTDKVVNDLLKELDDDIPF